MMERPDHEDFWLMAAIVQDCDAAAEDVGVGRTIPIDLESVAYMATQRALRAGQLGAQDAPAVMSATAWIDGFAVGYNFHKRQEAQRRRTVSVVDTSNNTVVATVTVREGEADG